MENFDYSDYKGCVAVAANYDAESLSTHLEYDGTTIVPRRGIQCSARSDKPHSHPRAHARLSVDSPYPKAWKKPNPSVGKGRLRLSSGEGNEYGIPDGTVQYLYQRREPRGEMTVTWNMRLAV